MCGIVGLRAPDVNRANLEQANRELLHRGPDEGGVYLGPGIGLGARRLSIIDLATGHQPLSNEDGTVWIAYNGEVFNASELRAELEHCGHRFRTHTDTETIVHGYEEWGDEVVARLRGMFAFGLWGARRERLLLARDRLAIKPLYYAEDRGRVAFASEIRPVFTLLPGLTRQANHESLTHRDGLRRPERFEAMLAACACDHRGRGEPAGGRPYPQQARLLAALHAVRGVDAGAIARRLEDKSRIPAAVHEARVAAVKALGAAVLEEDTKIDTFPLGERQ